MHLRSGRKNVPHVSVKRRAATNNDTPAISPPTLKPRTVTTRSMRRANGNETMVAAATATPTKRTTKLQRPNRGSGNVDAISDTTRAPENPSDDSKVSESLADDSALATAPVPAPKTCSQVDSATTRTPAKGERTGPLPECHEKAQPLEAAMAERTAGPTNARRRRKKGDAPRLTIMTRRRTRAASPSTRAEDQAPPVSLDIVISNALTARNAKSFNDHLDAVLSENDTPSNKDKTTRKTTHQLHLLLVPPSYCKPISVSTTFAFIKSFISQMALTKEEASTEDDMDSQLEENDVIDKDNASVKGKETLRLCDSENGRQDKLSPTLAGESHASCVSSSSSSWSDSSEGKKTTKKAKKAAITAAKRQSPCSMHRKARMTTFFSKDEDAAKVRVKKKNRRPLPLRRDKRVVHHALILKPGESWSRKKGTEEEASRGVREEDQDEEGTVQDGSQTGTEATRRKKRKRANQKREPKKQNAAAATPRAGKRKTKTDSSIVGRDGAGKKKKRAKKGDNADDAALVAADAVFHPTPHTIEEGPCATTKPAIVIPPLLKEGAAPEEIEQGLQTILSQKEELEKFIRANSGPRVSLDCLAADDDDNKTTTTATKKKKKKKENVPAEPLATGTDPAGEGTTVTATMPSAATPPATTVLGVPIAPAPPEGAASVGSVVAGSSCLDVGIPYNRRRLGASRGPYKCTRCGKPKQNHICTATMPTHAVQTEVWCTFPSDPMVVAAVVTVSGRKWTECAVHPPAAETPVAKEEDYEIVARPYVGASDLDAEVEGTCEIAGGDVEGSVTMETVLLEQHNRQGSPEEGSFLVSNSHGDGNQLACDKQDNSTTATVQQKQNDILCPFTTLAKNVATEESRVEEASAEGK